MPGLEQFGIPHDPNSTHQLHWKPGYWGKGIFSKDGILHHWPTGVRSDGDPGHRRYMMESPSFNYDPYGPNFRGNNDHAYFWISPEGNLNLLNRGQEAKELANQMSAIDPRLGYNGEDEWKFGGFNHQDRVLTMDEKREMYRNDPVNAEKALDWDAYIGQGDTYTNPSVEWVPTHELAKFMEYDRRPGGADSHSSPERWQALKDHIRQHGFNNPVILEVNPWDGHAHMGEGNHRTQIALELGIPAMPVYGYRSQRKSPTRIPINLQPRPEWEDKFDPSGYHYPTHYKPSWLGLPTVPPPTGESAWQFG